MTSANMRGYLSRLAYLESNGNNGARNRDSGATGRFQFLPSTLTDARQRLGINPSTLIADDVSVQYPAVAGYIRRINPDAYAEIEAGRFSAADRLLRGTWPSLPTGSQAQGSVRQRQADAFLPGGASSAAVPGGGSLAPGGGAVIAGPPEPLQTQNGSPRWQITIDDQDRTDTIGDRLLSITVMDFAGQQTDTVDIVIDDRDKRVEPPATGANLGIAIGYDGQQLQKIGSFLVDEVGFSNTPRTMTIKGLGIATGSQSDKLNLPRTATASGSKGSSDYIKKRRSESWHDTTLQAIAGKIAERNGFQLEIKGAVEIKIKHEDQTNESDANFMTRLAEKFGLVIKPTAGRLLVTPRAAGLLGKNILIREDQVTTWSARTKERARYRVVRSKWLDRTTQKEKVFTLTSKEAIDGSTFEIPELFRNEAEAQAGAAAKLRGLTSGIVGLNISMPGVPGVLAEGAITLDGFRDQVDGQPWVVRSVSHTISSSGFTTAIDAGSEGAEGEATPGEPGAPSSGAGASFPNGPTAAGTYIEGGWGPSGPGSYGPHFDIKRSDGGFFDRKALDQYVIVNGQPISRGATVDGGQFGASRDYGTHRAWDYAFGGGAKLQLRNGAQWTGSRPGSYGDETSFKTPDGQTYRIIHGKFRP